MFVRTCLPTPGATVCHFAGDSGLEPGDALPGTTRSSGWFPRVAGAGGVRACWHG